MPEYEKVELVKTMTGETNESTVSSYLAIAGAKICGRLYPFDTSIQEVPERYHLLQAEIAAYLMNKRGAEGELSHSENGISRSYENGDVPEPMMRQITPMAGVL